MSPHPYPLHPYFPNQINEFVNTELEFTHEYLKMPSHIAWNYKEEIFQTIDVPQGSMLNWSFGKKYLM